MSMMTELDELLAHLNQDRCERLLIDLVDIYSPSYAESAVVARVCEALQKAAVPYRLQPVVASPGAPGRANILVELGPQPPALMLVGHLDTVPYFSDEHDAPGSALDGGILHGLGSADMKSGCTAMVEATIALVDAGARLRRGFLLALVVGEEEYGDGAAKLLESSHAPLAIIGEPTGLRPSLEHYGYMELRLIAEGRRAHAARPDVGASAIHAMLSTILAIIEQVSDASPATRVSINPREVHGGDSLFVIADRCEAALDVHLAAGVDPAALRETLARTLETSNADHPLCNVSSEELFFAPAYRLDPDDPRMQTSRRAFLALQQPFTPRPFPSHSDGNRFFEAGIAPVILGPGDLGVAHTRDEHVHLSEVHRAAELYLSLIVHHCMLDA
ncbi:M20 family metallopeptidase [Lujinxingia vulgaris]|nr:M20/M25/M40 family metallo-hydrolase [Lujinxingia vulgaris]